MGSCIVQAQTRDRDTAAVTERANGKGRNEMGEWKAHERGAGKGTEKRKEGREG